MYKMIDSISHIRLLDELAQKESTIHKIHPLAKVLTTLVYLLTIASFGRYEIGGLLPHIIYPILIFAFGELPVAPILKRVLIVEPVIIGIGILNPLFDRYMVAFGGIAISRGWVTFLSIFTKCGLTIIASLLLVATTEIDKLAFALRMLRIPKIFVLQLLLTYRYISVLLEEVYKMQRAYFLRAPGHKGIHRHVWGSFAGHLVLKTFERAQRVYQSMSLRGFNGEYNTGTIPNIAIRDVVYMAGWSLFFILARIFNIPNLLGSMFIGVINR